MPLASVVVVATTLPAAVAQHHGHAGEAAGLAAHQRAVGIRVVPDRAGDGVGAAGVAVAEVLGRLIPPAGKDHGRGAVVAAVRVDRVGQPGVGQGAGLHLDDISSGRQVAEEVLAVFVGGGRRHQGGAVEQRTA